MNVIYSRIYRTDRVYPQGQYFLCFRELVNKRTKTIGVSHRIVETVISNYEDGFIDDDEFVRILAMFDKSPEDFGFCMDAEIDDDLKDFFESEED